MKVKSIIIATLALLMTVSCFGQSKKYKNIYDITVKDIKWNFGKFLVSKDGKTILRFEPMVSPEGLEGAIQEMLKE